MRLDRLTSVEAKTYLLLATPIALFLQHFKAMKVHPRRLPCRVEQFIEDSGVYTGLVIGWIYYLVPECFR